MATKTRGRPKNAAPVVEKAVTETTPEVKAEERPILNRARELADKEGHPETSEPTVNLELVDQEEPEVVPTAEATTEVVAEAPKSLAQYAEALQQAEQALENAAEAVEEAQEAVEDAVSEADLAGIEEAAAGPLTMSEQWTKWKKAIPEKETDRKRFRRTMRQFADKRNLTYTMVNGFYVFPDWAIGQEEDGTIIWVPATDVKDVPTSRAPSNNGSKKTRKRKEASEKKSIAQGFTYRLGHTPVEAAKLRDFSNKLLDELSGPFEHDELEATDAYFAISLVAVGEASRWDVELATQIVKERVDELGLVIIYDTPLSYLIHDDLIMFGPMRRPGEDADGNPLDDSDDDEGQEDDDE